MSDIADIYLGVKPNSGKKSGAGLLFFHPITIIVAALLVILGHGLPLMAYAAALILHEFAHAITAEKLGYGLTKIRIMPYGISMSGEFDCMRPGHEAAVAAAGPFINLLVWLLFHGIWWQFPGAYPYTFLIAETNLFLAIINLIPIFPLDGGRIVRGLLSLKLNKKTAHKISRIIGLILGGGIIAACITAIILGANYSYATMAIFLLASAMLPGEDVRYDRIYSMAYASKRLKNGLPVKEIMVSGEKPLVALFKMLGTNHYTRFLICDEKFSVAAIISETDLESLLSRYGGNAPVISVL